MEGGEEIGATHARYQVQQITYEKMLTAEKRKTKIRRNQHRKKQGGKAAK